MKYPLFKVNIDPSVIAGIQDVFNSGFINEGIQVTELTEVLKPILGSEQLVLTNSCTSALTMALHLAGVGPGDDVVTTPMTCVASNTPIIQRGANIVWSDINPRTGMPDCENILEKLTPKTKAVIVVAWAGSPLPHLDFIYDACKKRNIKLILDGAHAFMAKHCGQDICKFADYTCFSFQAIKHFTTGDGGALICVSKEDYQRSKAMKWFGLDRDATKDAQGNWKGQQWDTDIIEAGYKFNINNVAAAIGLANLTRSILAVTQHRYNASLYQEYFTGNPYVEPLTLSSASQSSFWVYGMLVKPSARFQRDELLERLNTQGIGAGLVHVPNDTYTCFRQFKSELPGVREFANRQFSLPCGWWLKPDDVKHIASVTTSIMSGENIR